MYRVITKSMIMVREGGRKRQVDQGPWQMSEGKAHAWAKYLEKTGLYDTVIVQSNGQHAIEAATEGDLSI